MWTNEQLNYIAGLLEGEGSFQKRGKRGISIQCHMTDLDVLEKLRQAIGQGSVSGPYKNSQEHHKLRYMYKVGSRDFCLMLLKLLHPLMGSRRQQQIQECINHRELHPARCYHLKNIKTGEEVWCENLEYFCRENGLSSSNLWRTNKGIRKQHHGWVWLDNHNLHANHRR